MRSFGSDNNSGVHPQILKAMANANENHAIAYGNDPWTEKAVVDLRSHFGQEADPFFVFNGTGANVIALTACTRSFHSIFCADTAHIAVDECGAPVKMSGTSLQQIPTVDGKLTPESIRPYLSSLDNEHHSQPKAVYISQCTELGTVYTAEEIKSIASLIHPYGMYLHMDGARLANAAAFLGKSLKEITVDCGVDILSFGGTKNGMMMGESVISFRPELSENLKYIRKQSSQLFSKMRYLSVQFSSYFSGDLWLKNALHANCKAQQLREGIDLIFPGSFTRETQANIVLFRIPEKAVAFLLQRHFFYIWNEAEKEVRLVTSWDTTEEDIAFFLEDLQESAGLQ